MRSLTDYRYEAFKEEMNVLWGGTKFKNELSHLTWCASQVCWLDNTHNDNVDRRNMVWQMSRAVLSEETLKRYERIIPSTSAVDLYADQVATLYNTPPQRYFHSSDTVNADFDTIYRRANVDSMLKKAYRYSLFTNVVAAYPYIDSMGVLQIGIITPDKFRLEFDDDGNVIEFWTIHAVKQRGTSRQRTEFRVWTPEYHYRADYKGVAIANTIEENRYGRIPRVFLRLDAPIADEFYGGGETDIVDLSVWMNMMRLSTTKAAILQGFAILAGLNIDEKQMFAIGPDKLINMQHTDATQPEPGLNYISAPNTYDMVESYVQGVMHHSLRMKGIPGFALDDNGTPPTGVALEVLERSITEKRKGHASAISVFENNLAELTALVVNTDGGRSIATTLPTNLPDFSVHYETSRRFIEPSVEYGDDMKRAADGLIYPSTIVSKYLGIEGGLTDEEAVDMVMKNRALWQRISNDAVATASTQSTSDIADAI